MATQSKVVIYNPTTKQHEPLAAATTKVVLELI